MQVQINVSPTRFTEHAPTQRHTTRCPAGIIVFHKVARSSGSSSGRGSSKVVQVTVVVAVVKEGEVAVVVKEAIALS